MGEVRREGVRERYEVVEAGDILERVPSDGPWPIDHLGDQPYRESYGKGCKHGPAPGSTEGGVDGGPQEHEGLPVWRRVLEHDGMPEGGMQKDWDRGQDPAKGDERGERYRGAEGRTAAYDRGLQVHLPQRVGGGSEPADYQQGESDHLEGEGRGMPGVATVPPHVPDDRERRCEEGAPYSIIDEDWRVCAHQ